MQTVQEFQFTVLSFFRIRPARRNFVKPICTGNNCPDRIIDEQTENKGDRKRVAKFSKEYRGVVCDSVSKRRRDEYFN